MFRRLSASGLALVMIAIIALRFPTLGFCLCEDHLILNDGTCCAEPVIDLHACDCCEEPAIPDPCEDCVFVLTLDPGDFLWSVDQFSPPAQIGFPVALPPGLHDDLPHPAIAAPCAGPIRGSPPWGDHLALLRTQVLRL